MSRNGANLLTVLVGCSMLTATAASFAGSDTSRPAPSDSQITHQVMDKLSREMPESFVDLKVQTENGVVTLSGRANTAFSKLKAEQNARQVPGVAGVKDELRVAM